MLLLTKQAAKVSIVQVDESCREERSLDTPRTIALKASYRA